jgi:cyclic pyranopterin phosphate synthase
MSVNPEEILLHPKAAEHLQKMEAEVPFYVEIDEAIRAKVTDACGMTCLFCHNEGTPVVSQLGTQALRVSIYEADNGVDSMPTEMKANDSFIDALSSLQDRIGANELHWTGGEPTLSRDIVEMTRVAHNDLGMRVKMTSNGELGSRKITELAEAGLSGINFSIFGANAPELSAVQLAASNNPQWAERKLQRLHEAIYTAVASGVNVGANVVVNGPQDADRATNIIQSYPPAVTVRLQGDLENQAVAWASIYDILSELEAVPVNAVATAGTSSIKVVYRLPDGRQVDFKRFMDVKLPDTCIGCSYNNPIDCREGFYGLRLYASEEGYKVGVCLRRMDLTTSISDFLSGTLPNEIQRLREREYLSLATRGNSVLRERIS